MRKLYLNTFCLLVLLYTSKVICYVELRDEPNQPTPVPLHTINMDLPFKDRWRDVISIYKPAIQSFFNYVDKAGVVSKLSRGLAFFGSHFYHDQEFIEEVRAIAELAEVDFGMALSLNWLNELSTILACTSIVARNSENRIIHARNLDFGFTNYLPQMMASVTFIKNGQPVYQSDMIMGTLIIASGIRFNGFGITLNDRFKGGSWNLYYLLIAQYTPPCYLIHQVLREKQTYQEALEALSKTKIATNTYFILSGLQGNEGAVIERNRADSHAIYYLTEQNWFLVQTNYDRDIPDPENDPRRTVAEERMEELPANFNEANIFDVLDKYPNLNSSTLTTDIMCPKTNYYNAQKWY
ncbi:N-acylethanolamine-hydrolyzing acid amidase (macronuclear) [Tetrahymena thermophila SB210]|uniref:Acid ceramidase n=1 Tax=Tetrahymena thermophila (strain SB210) TaxID=312017 RepID=Q22AK2_TETTS|nr:N-acylethanolamine-hydrolyzing acid amidase [Tetrahymena thermophila SB210]EAR82314.1 N-acylethanolamine-hydrolyzing acid amidase [Tetrahymena thermophila SB210]|eukprot:XP_001029977.1 N-acylethanolamine-hydrolyzing acid amidase [Tetrahymena thermophila SB210]